MSSLNYRPEIDGLRAVAVIPVVLFHLGFSWINGGYLGVDVFFVISGFLITSILLKENNANTFSYKEFWKKRIRRILPALLMMVIGVLVASYFLAFRPVLQSFAEDGLSAMFSYANLNMLLKFGDYWGPAAGSSPFLHAWSLAVEEQFYLLYPALIVLFFLFKVKTWPVLAIITIISFGLFLYTSIAYPKYGFYLLPTRAWELAAGGLLAATAAQLRALLGAASRNLLSILGLIFILASYFLFPSTQVISMVSVLPVLGAVLFIGFASADNIAGRLLSNKVLVFVGKISYSLYLWHWPVIVLARHYGGLAHYSRTEYLAWIVIIISVLSLASYLLVEIPTRKFKPILSLVTFLFVICLSLIAVFRSDLVKANYPLVFNTTKFYGLYYNINPHVSTTWQTKQSDRAGVQVPLQKPSFKATYAHGGIPAGKGKGNPSMVLLGDSHGGMWARVVDEIGSELNIKASIYTINGTSPLFKIPYKEDPSADIGAFTNEQWKIYAKGLVHNLNTWKPKVLMVSCRWSIRSAADFHNLESLISLAGQNGTSVILLNEQPDVVEIEDYNATQYLSFLGLRPNGKAQYLPLAANDSVQVSNAELNVFASKFSNCKVVDVNRLFRKNNKVMVLKDKSVLYFDDDHLSYQGTLVAKQLIKNAISEAEQRHS
jgi:peptidoglycan/LPS O-acetylase OafA/YrhL